MPKLADMAPGTQIRITGYQADTEYTAHLQRLGLVPGTQVRVLRRAPLGDPLEIRLRGYSLALRPSEADMMLFDVIES